MDDLKKGDIIVATAGDVREEVLARLEDLVFTQRLFPDGSRGHVSGATEISDLVNFGFTKETN